MLKIFFYKIFCKIENLYLQKYFSAERRIKYRYRKKYGEKLNLDNPIKFSEKIQYRKLNEKNELFSICSDKIKVKEYAKNKIGEKHIIPYYQIANSWEELNFLELPKEFIVKTNHDSGTVFIINDKNTELKKLQKIEKRINKSLKTDFGKLSDEKFYSAIERKVYVEKLLKTLDGKIPPDFKFHMFKRIDKNFNIIIQVDIDRFEDHKRGFYTEDWIQLPYITSSYHKIIDFDYKAPKSLKKMIEIAKKMAEDFDYVRVDLYDTDEEIYLGELTFAHGSGFEKFTKTEGDLEFGKYWECFKK